MWLASLLPPCLPHHNGMHTIDLEDNQPFFLCLNCFLPLLPQWGIWIKIELRCRILNVYLHPRNKSRNLTKIKYLQWKAQQKEVREDWRRKPPWQRVPQGDVLEAWVIVLCQLKSRCLKGEAVSENRKSDCNLMPVVPKQLKWKKKFFSSRITFSSRQCCHGILKCWLHQTLGYKLRWRHNQVVFKLWHTIIM